MIKLTEEQRQKVDKVILFTNVRDEKNMKEWVAHHLLIGFDEIYIYDHKSIVPLSGQFDNFNKEYEKVFVKRCELDGPIKCYLIQKSVITAKVTKADWMIYLDADEFFVINTDKINNVKDLLKLYTNADLVAFNWLMFGSNFHINEPDGLIIDNYTKSQLKLCDHIKSFLRPSQFLKPNPHRCDIINPFRMYHGSKRRLWSNSVLFDNPIEYYKSIAFIAHYYVQSKETYLRRKLTLPRDDNGTIRPNNQTIMNQTLTENYSIDNDLNDIINTSVRDKYSEKIKLYLKSIGE